MNGDCQTNNTKTVNNIIWNTERLKWIDIINPSNEELKEYSSHYKLDYYTLHDCLEPAHLPKKENLPEFTFIILRMYDQKVKHYPSTIQEMSNKIAVFYKGDTIITIHRKATPVIEEIKTSYLEKGILTETSEIVTKLMWYVVKSFEPISITLSEDIDKMENKVFIGKQSKITLGELYYLRNTCRLSKKVIGITKEVIMQHTTTKKDSSALQDVKDLLLKLSHSFEETHDDSQNLSNSYLSLVSLKTNEVMKLLTIFSVFFMPLTFIAGIYGMNFEFMPELGWKLGYPIILIFMLMVSLLIFLWFKRKKIF